MTDPGGNNGLAALRVTPGDLSPAFSPNILTYTVNVASAVTSVTVSATKVDANAGMSGDVSALSGIPTGHATMQLQPPGATTGITIWVSACGTTQKTYTVNVIRATPSANNNLSALTVSPGTLSPSFHASCTSYSLSVGHAVDKINVSATKMDSTAVMAIDGESASSGEAHSINLNAPGASTQIAVTVTAPNGSSNTYAITANRDDAFTVANLTRKSKAEPTIAIVKSKFFPDSPQKVTFLSDEENPVSAREVTSNVFISYRREDSDHVTGRIDDRLVQQFGREAVFIDVDSMPFGLDFRTYLDAQVAKCDVFLSVIGPDWMGPRDSRGRTRLEDPRDFVRIEIESALQRQIPVIPVLVRGASVPPAEQLPQSLQDLPYRHGISVRSGPDFHRDMDRLIKYLRTHLQTKREHPPNPETRHIEREMKVPEESTHSESASLGTEVAEVESGSAGPYTEEQRIGLDEEERAASISIGKPSTHVSQSYVLVGLGLLVLIGAMVAFMVLQAKSVIDPVIEKNGKSVMQVIPPPSPPRTAEPKEQERSGSASDSSVPIPHMIRISPGTFMMQPYPGGTAHKVHINKPFAIAQYETTFDDYDRFVETTNRQSPSDQGWGRGRRPVIYVSWQDATDYTKWLSKVTGKKYRLPTESEWEYAARSEGKEEYLTETSEASRWRQYAVIDQTKTEPAGSRKPNGLGLYDMTGNVYELLQDCFHLYSSIPKDESAWFGDNNDGVCDSHVIRGGSWSRPSEPSHPSYERAFSRNESQSYELGFRLAQDIEPEP